MSVTPMPPSAASAASAAQQAPKKSRKKLLVVVLVVLLAAAGAYWQFLRPAPASAEAPKPGEVVALEPIQVNLAAERYLRLGIALQLTEEAYEADGSKALDAAIETFSGRPIAEVNDNASRKALKKQLTEELDELYHGEVMAIYFTEFVTQ